MCVQLAASCRKHSRYRALRYPRQGAWNSKTFGRCDTCVVLWYMKRGMLGAGGLASIPTGAVKWHRVVA